MTIRWRLVKKDMYEFNNNKKSSADADKPARRV